MDPAPAPRGEAEGMTTSACTADVVRVPPAWMSWIPRLAFGWATAYGLVRVWFATGHAPEWNFPGGDLLIPDWPSVAACLVSAALVVAATTWSQYRVVIGLLWAAAAGWVAVAAMALLDVVGGLLPGLGIPWDLPGMLSRFGALVGAALLAGTALARQRQLDPTCFGCSGRRRVLTSTPRWAVAAAWIAVGGCLLRLAAQAVVGFETTPYAASLSMLLFEGGFLLAGIALPLLLVYRLGKVFPRWMLLLPGAGLGVGITAYFGVGLLQMIAETLQGKVAFDDIDLPQSFFWVAVPAYLAWGVGLAVATYGYYVRTRKPCRSCGR